MTDRGHKEMAVPEPNSRILRDPNVLAKRADDQIVLVHLETNRIFELNRTGAFLWDALAEPSSRAELAKQLALEFDVDREELAREIDELVGQLMSERLVRAE